MKAIEIRNKYLKFFESKGHKIIPRYATIGSIFIGGKTS